VSEVIRNFTAGGTVGDRLLVKPHSTAGQVVIAAAAGDLIIGVSAQPSGAASGQPIDVQLTGVADVLAGGTIAAGGPVTANNAGKAVAAAPAAGANARVAGFALTAAADGDIIPVLLAPHTMQGA
jgi:hypothetical protein